MPARLGWRSYTRLLQAGAAGAQGGRRQPGRAGALLRRHRARHRQRQGLEPAGLHRGGRRQPAPADLRGEPDLRRLPRRHRARRRQHHLVPPQGRRTDHRVAAGTTGCRAAARRSADSDGEYAAISAETVPPTSSAQTARPGAGSSTPTAALDAQRLPGLRSGIAALTEPSPARALALDKAYRLMVEEQSFAKGRLPVLDPLDGTVYREVGPGTATGIAARCRPPSFTRQGQPRPGMAEGSAGATPAPCRPLVAQHDLPQGRPRRSREARAAVVVFDPTIPLCCQLAGRCSRRAAGVAGGRWAVPDLERTGRLRSGVSDMTTISLPAAGCVAAVRLCPGWPAGQAPEGFRPPCSRARRRCRRDGGAAAGGGRHAAGRGRTAGVGFTISALSEQGRPLEAASGGVTEDQLGRLSQDHHPRRIQRGVPLAAHGGQRLRHAGDGCRIPVKPDGDAAHVRTLNIGTYINSFSNTEQQSSCRSTGTLERQLIEAVRTEADRSGLPHALGQRGAGRAPAASPARSS